MPRVRVVLNTNVLISGLAYPEGNCGRIVSAWRQGGIAVVLSRYILDEMIRVLPRLSRVALTGEEIRELADSFLFLAEIVDQAMELEGSLRDPADQQILATLRTSRADYLVTGDKDLLALSDRYPMITPAAFWIKHGG
jgi:uncharacterized protein